MKKFSGIWLLFALVSFSALAVTRTWLPGAVGDFTDPANWTGNAYPAADDTVNMSVGSATISEGMDIVVKYLITGRTNSFDIVQTGGSVRAAYSGDADAGFKVGRGETERANGSIRAEYTLSGGTVSTPSRVTVGEFATGFLTITGTGKLSTPYRVQLAVKTGSTGIVHVVSGGRIEANAIELVRVGSTLLFDGGTYCATGTTSAANTIFLTGAADTSATIGNGGAVFDTNGRFCKAAIPLVASGVQASPVGIEKIGAGTLWLAATNTYNGPTVVSAGTLVAETPESLPGYATAGMVTVRSGAVLQFGAAWTAAQQATLRANAVVENGADISPSSVYNTASGNKTVSENLALAGGLDKFGANTLFLTGNNTLGGNVRIYAGTLQADFGQGLDANHAVELLGGALSSANGSITAGLGTGAGQITVSSGMVPAFTAKGVPLTVKLGDTDVPIVFGSALFPVTSLILNTSEADQKITLANSFDLNGKIVSLTVNKNSAVATGRWITSSAAADSALDKYGTAPLAFEGPLLIRRLNTYAGTTILNNQEKNVLGLMNIREGSTLAATNQTISITNNLNVMAGTLLLNDCTVTNVSQVTTGYDEANNAMVKRIVIDGGTTYGKTLYAGYANRGNGEIEIDNDANVSFDQIFVRGGTITQNGGTVTTRNNSGISTVIGYYTNGTYVLNDGMLNCGYHFQLGREKGLGTFRQTGGTNTVMGVCSIGWGSGGTGEVYVTGGVLREPVAKNFRVGEGSVGYLEVSGSGEVQTGNDTSGTASARLSIAHDGKAGSGGRVLLGYGGTIEAMEVAGNNGKNGCYSEFFFNGGTLRATTKAPAKYLYNLTTFGMGELGGAVDSNGRNITFSNALAATSSHIAQGEGLTHRWSFNGDLKDSIGGQDATAYIYTFTNGNSELALTPASGSSKKSYVDLGSNILPRDGSPATIEIWATQREVRNFSRIFDVGVDGSDYVTMSWTKSEGINTDMIRIRKGASSVSNKMAPYTLGTEFHIALVLYPLPNDGGWVATAYKQDAVTGETLKSTSFTNATWTLPSLVQTYCYLGRSVQSDADAAANYNEVRIWNRALSEWELAANVRAGPDVLPSFVFEKKGAGKLTLTGANTYRVDTRVTGGTLELGATSSLPSTTGVELADGAELALGGNSQTVAALTGSGTVSGGNLTVTGAINPGTSTNETATLTFSNASAAGTLELDATETAIDNIDCTAGTFDLTGLSLQINNIEALTGASYTLATSGASGITGQFAGTNLAGTPWQVSYHRNAVLLSRGGTIFMVR